MKLNTRHFGEIQIDKVRIITFPEGLLGFEDKREFIIINSTEEGLPFQWLQSIDDPGLAFVIINPFLFRKDYEFDISQSVVEMLKIEDQKDLIIYTIVVIPEDISKMTANLAGPIIINTNHKLGKQIVLEDKRYKTKHLILEELKDVKQEE